MRRWGRKKKREIEIHPDEILLDAANTAGFDTDRFEGRIERPLSRRSVVAAGSVVSLIFVALLFRAGDLQIAQGATLSERAQQNQLAQTTLFADRGVITDRTGTPLAWNERADTSTSTQDFATRAYTTLAGLGHVVGYVQPPAKDSSGNYYRNEFVGMDGAEKAFGAALAGQNGLKLTETDAHGAIVSESTVEPPVPGKQLTLSIDATVTNGLYESLATHAQDAGATGAAGVIMNVHTGEILALASYPDYSPEAMESGDTAAITAYNADRNLPFLNRVTDGLYAPGSTIKPVMAAAGLQEGVITPSTLITSTGQISVPNPYDPSNPSVFKDWRVNGTMTVRDALAVSSDVFFYEVGGGYKNQPGIGISNIDKYFAMFGFGKPAGLTGFVEATGTIPTPQWKAATFPTDPTWRLGDTYHTSIGQYGMQVTPLQSVREAAAVANGGLLLTPTLLASSTPVGTQLPIDPKNLEVVREGMREGVTQGIVQAINFSFVEPAGKTGTAQVGTHNQWQNAWMIGFWPYNNPEWAFAVVLEKLPAGSPIGGSAVMSDFFVWMDAHAPQYLQ